MPQVPRAKPPRDGVQTTLLPHKERYSSPLKSQSMQHLCKQVIRSFQIEGGVHDLLQCQPIKNGEQESRQERWIERRTLRTFCPLTVL